MPLTSGQTFAGYTIIRLLGSGGIGDVYLARYPRLPRRDVLKLLPCERSELATAEVLLAAFRQSPPPMPPATGCSGEDNVGRESSARRHQHHRRVPTVG